MEKVSGTFFVVIASVCWYTPRMGRPLRAAPGGGIYHVWNRANGRQGIFETAGDYEAFERVLIEGHDRGGHADPGVLCHAQSLALGGMAASRGRPLPIHGLVDVDPHATMACVPSFDGEPGICIKDVSSRFPCKVMSIF